jgi:hypothetical protein
MPTFNKNHVIRHAKGGLYKINAVPDSRRLEHNNQPFYEYESIDDGQTWLRSQAEMEDGRFTLTELEANLEADSLNSDTKPAPTLFAYAFSTGAYDTYLVHEHLMHTQAFSQDEIHGMLAAYLMDFVPQALVSLGKTFDLDLTINNLPNYDWAFMDNDNDDLVYAVALYISNKRRITDGAEDDYKWQLEYHSILGQVKKAVAQYFGANPRGELVDHLVNSFGFQAPTQFLEFNFKDA